VQTPLVVASGACWIALAFWPHHVHARSWSRLDLGGAALDWALMLGAMMVPLLGPALHHLRTQSFVTRRARVSALFVIAYLAVWMLAGTVVFGVSRLGWPIVGLVALWQISPFKQRALNRLFRHPTIPAFGLAADLGAVRFGLGHGAFCIGSCWALMALGFVFPSAHWPIMIATSVWIWREQARLPAAPRWAFARRGPSA
jgi:predicted metal-binding membrane protein